MAQFPALWNEVGTVAVRRQSGLVLVFVAVVTVTGCQTSGSGSESASTVQDTTRSRTSVSVPSGTTCAAVATDGQALGAAVVKFVDGSGTADQVRSAAADLSDALAEAGSTAKDDAAAAFAEVQSALDRLLTSLQTQPIDRAGVRTASTDVLSALGDAVAFCEPAPTS